MASMFDLTASQRRAELRLRSRSPRKSRSDRGRSRLPHEVLTEVQRAAQGFHRPVMARLHRRVAALCARTGRRPPARGSLYNAFDAIEPHCFAIASLPPGIGGLLYNLSPDGALPGPQLVFYCLNYGSLPAFSFAAALPWLDLHQARRMRGWRPRSRGLLDAILAARGRRPAGSAAQTSARHPSRKGRRARPSSQ